MSAMTLRLVQPSVFECFLGDGMPGSGAYTWQAMHQSLQVVFIFLPMLPLKIGDVLNVMIAFDIAGALLRWRRFDHLGHLGGMPGVC